MNFVQACVECKKNGGEYANDAGEVKMVKFGGEVLFRSTIFIGNDYENFSPFISLDNIPVFCQGELHKVTDWTKVKVDTPILVPNLSGGFIKRHFKSFKGGLLYYYTNGRTSWSAGESGPVGMLRPNECKLAEIGEVNNGE